MSHKTTCALAMLAGSGAIFLKGFDLLFAMPYLEEGATVRWLASPGAGVVAAFLALLAAERSKRRLGPTSRPEG